jgi:hypothetical protein
MTTRENDELPRDEAYCPLCTVERRERCMVCGVVLTLEDDGQNHDGVCIDCRTDHLH